MAGMRPAFAEPKRGGTLRLGMGTGSANDSLDPALAIDTFPIVLNFGCLRNCLTEVGPDGQLRPELAESWDISPDAKVWTFRIRSGVEFHDGRTLTPSDVVATLRHHGGESSTSTASSIIAGIEDMTIDGDNVRITLVEGNADFGFLMSFYALGIMPATDDGVDWASGVGTGAYVLQDFQPGVRARLSRNPNYWKPNAAYFDEVELLSIRDTTTRQNAVTTGDVDVVERIDPRTARLLQRANGVTLREIQGLLHYTFSMNAPEAPFSDNNVRMALKYGVNREAMVQTILSGHGAVGNDQPIGPANKFYAADLEQRTYDPDRSKYFLRQAGMDKLTVPLHISDAAFPGAVDAALMYQEQAAESGITIDVVREPSEGYFSNIYRRTPFFGSYWSGRPTEDWIFSQGYASDGALNETQWKNERFDELLGMGRLETDDSLRAEIYRECQEILRDDGATLIPMFANHMFAHRETVVVPETIGSNYNLDGYKGVERWWAA
ncbi:MAG: peptide ABC transporter substrate-binding protein [Rhodobacteraceae bacterium]|nr:peptide ABC transporter substrate-binding protein [Paracoccaceae bacterium]